MKYKMILLIFIVFTMANPISVFANDSSEMDYTDYNSYDFSDIEEVLNKNESDFDFGQTVKKMISGDVDSSLNDIGEMIIDYLFAELKDQKNNIIKILIIGVIAAVFSNFAAAFLNSEITEAGFYIAYMLMSCFLFGGYALAADIVKKVLGQIIELMEAVVPVYVLSIGFSQGDASATGFYNVIVIIIVLIENVLLKFIIPIIYVYAITGFINNISSKNMLSKACELIKTIVEWLLKALMSVVIGINLVQSLINPIVDSVKTTSIGKALSLIPGVGGMLTSVSGVLLGAGTLVKNAIGVTAMTAILVISFIPVIKIVVMSLSYKIVGAVLEPVSDNRITGSINSIYESTSLLLRTLLYAVVFFILTIGIICATTNHRIS